MMNPGSQPLATAEFTTLRMRLIKIAARIVETASRVRIAFAAARPEAALFTSLARCLHRPGRDERGVCPATTRSRQPLAPHQIRSKTTMKSRIEEPDSCSERRPCFSKMNKVSQRPYGLKTEHVTPDGQIAQLRGHWTLTGVPEPPICAWLGFRSGARCSNKRMRRNAPFQTNQDVRPAVGRHPGLAPAMGYPHRKANQ
jgi:Transposase DDE domain group 1